MKEMLSKHLNVFRRFVINHDSDFFQIKDIK